MGKTIFIAAYRNFSVRYILGTEIFSDLLKNEDLNFVLFFHDNDLDFHKSRLDHPRIKFESLRYSKGIDYLKKDRLNRFFILVRKCMSGSDGVTVNFTDGVRLKMYEKEQSDSWFRRIEFRAVQAVAYLCSKSRATRIFVLNLESWLFSGKYYDQVFEKHRPSAVIVSSIGYMIDSYFMRAARRHHAKIISVIHSWDNPTTKDYRGGDPDLVVTWNELMKKEVNIFHDIDEKKIVVGGIAHWDRYFQGQSSSSISYETVWRQLGLDPGKKTVFFGTSSFRIFPNTFEVIGKILEAIENGPLPKNLQLLVRLHPSYLVKDKNRKLAIEKYQLEIDRLIARHSESVRFNIPKIQILPDDMFMDPDDLDLLSCILKNSDVMLTEYSTLMIEGAIFDLPIVNVAVHEFRDFGVSAAYVENYSHIKRILSSKATRNAYTYESLFDIINAYLRDPSIDRTERKNLVHQEVTTNRGFAGQYIAKEIKMFLDKH